MDKGRDPSLWNEDLAPVGDAARTWDWKSYAALWVAMVVCVPTYLLAGGLIAEGMSWSQAVLTVFLGNAIVLVPMVLVGHAGARYGLPYPVLLRSAFGTTGARFPAMARGLVACGWFGINTWVGGSAIYVILNTLTHGALKGTALPVLGIDGAQALCFLAFWGAHLYFIRHGTESIRWLETLSAPFLILMCLVLLGWAYVRVGSWDAMLGGPSAFAPGGPREGQFWPVFVKSLTAMVGFWATMALNIPDFTRFARSQRDQMLGQALGLPIPMAALAFVSVAVTGASARVFGAAIWDPVELAGHLGGMGVILALAALLVATLTTNLAANVVGPAYDISSLAPRHISFRMGGYITAGIGVAMFPWKLLASAGTYLFTWLVGYSALLGPIAGVLLADYYLIRRTHLVVDELFSSEGRYSGVRGWNLAGLGAVIVAVLPNLPGFLHAGGLVDHVPPVFDTIYTYAWFVGFGIAFLLYLAMGRKER
ncbi:NCS1 family nucleobase:cation symporter-1 [Sphingopyxis sp. SE2]|uniref:NCS1 family nucleobase:cation symporter-1 n=1 Tax=Sphingopyxis sp. SE2 TaxID=1586240 RepID=UPI0028C18C7C|nr:NCS1 family nucleobase:cation symporter-1 [Sphingopyxis sp. SE2]MDT7531621.1 NCS1 family nucleobase:cation symporter-1 [Sphingopyxis sp. SE2]